MDTHSRAGKPLFSTRRSRALLAAGIAAALAAVLVAALVARGGSASSARAPGTVDAHKTSLGTVLASRSGRTLYLFAADKRGMSACTASACVEFWPPLVAKGRPTAGKGVKTSLLGTIRRPGGVRQVTYAGHPLYTFALDKGAGQTKGEGLNDFGGKWWAVSTAGRKVVKAPASTSGSSGGGAGSSGGYGY
jgi:predicted lipoprotein with Yx(FWY)xxD motif